jgi:hypothetical protein
MFNSYSLVLAVAFGTSWLSSSVIGSVLPAEKSVKSRQDTGSQWVDTWTSMPQLVEPGNLPPAPFVRLHRSRLRSHFKALLTITIDITRSCFQ